MKVVKLYGRLAEFCGARSFKAEITSAAEAVRFLLANFPDLEKFLIDGDKEGYGYKVKVGRSLINPHTDLHHPTGERGTISIIPVIMGAGGGGFGRILAGVGLIALSVLTAGIASGFAFGFAGGVLGLGTFATVGAGIGLSLALGGIAQVLTPVPKLSTASPLMSSGYASSQRGDRGDPKRLESYNFSGIQNTSSQGLPVPVIYGRIWVGSVTISAGIDIV